MNPWASILHPQLDVGVRIVRHLKQNRVEQFQHIILWHSLYCVFCLSKFSFVIPMRQVGHCLVPVSSSQRIRASSSSLLLLATGFFACASQVRPVWNGWAPHRMQDTFLHIVHLNLGLVPSSTATRIGQFGVGQAHRSALLDTACSKLRSSSRSMTSYGNNFRKSYSASAVRHSGHWTLGSPT